MTSAGWPVTSMVAPGTVMLEVGFSAMLDDDILAGGDAAEHAAGMIGLEAPRRQLVAVFAAELLHRLRKPAPISTALTALMPIMALGEVGIEPVEHRLTRGPAARRWR